MDVSIIKAKIGNKEFAVGKVITFGEATYMVYNQDTDSTDLVDITALDAYFGYENADQVTNMVHALHANLETLPCE